MRKKPKQKEARAVLTINRPDEMMLDEKYELYNWLHERAGDVLEIKPWQYQAKMRFRLMK